MEGANTLKERVSFQTEQFISLVPPNGVVELGHHIPVEAVTTSSFITRNPYPDGGMLHLLPHLRAYRNACGARIRASLPPPAAGQAALVALVMHYTPGTPATLDLTIDDARQPEDMGELTPRLSQEYSLHGHASLRAVMSNAPLGLCDGCMVGILGVFDASNVLTVQTFVGPFAPFERAERVSSGPLARLAVFAGPFVVDSLAGGDQHLGTYLMRETLAPLCDTVGVGALDSICAACPAPPAPLVTAIQEARLALTRTLAPLRTALLRAVHSVSVDAVVLMGPLLPDTSVFSTLDSPLSERAILHDILLTILRALNASLARTPTPPHVVLVPAPEDAWLLDPTSTVLPICGSESTEWLVQGVLEEVCVEAYHASVLSGREVPLDTLRSLGNLINIAPGPCLLHVSGAPAAVISPLPVGTFPHAPDALPVMQIAETANLVLRARSVVPRVPALPTVPVTPEAVSAVLPDAPVLIQRAGPRTQACEVGGVLALAPGCVQRDGKSGEFALVTVCEGPGSTAAVLAL